MYMLPDKQPYDLQTMQNEKYWRILLEDTRPHDQSNVSVSLQAKTGYYADEYIVPATTGGPIFTILSDESMFRDHAAISIVLMPYENPGEDSVVTREGALEDLCRVFKIDNIHFADIFGQDLLGKQRREFLDKYLNVVNGKTMGALSFSASKTSLQKRVPEIQNDLDYYFVLFWNAIEQMVSFHDARSIYHIWFEQENNLSAHLVESHVSRLYNGLRHCKVLQDKQISICKHPFFFSKKALLYSSLADLVAYANNRLQAKLDQGIPTDKIKNSNRELIETVRAVFGRDNYLSMHQSGRGVAQLINGEL